MILYESSMLTLLSVLHVDNGPFRPVKCVSNKAYGYTRHLHPLHTSLELYLKHLDQLAVAEEEDAWKKWAWKKWPRNAVGMSFNNIVRNFLQIIFPSKEFCRMGCLP